MLKAFYKAEFSKYFISSGKYIFLILALLPLFGLINISFEENGEVLFNGDWLSEMAVANAAFAVLQIVFFITAEKFCFKEIKSGYLDNNKILSADKSLCLKQKSNALIAFSSMSYALEIILLVIIYFTAKAELDYTAIAGQSLLGPGKSLIFLIYHFLAYAVIYMQILYNIFLWKSDSYKMIVILLFLAGRLFEQSPIFQYIFPWNMSMMFYLRIDDASGFSLFLKFAALVLYFVILKLIEAFLIKKNLNESESAGESRI